MDKMGIDGEQMAKDLANRLFGDRANDFTAKKVKKGKMDK